TTTPNASSTGESCFCNCPKIASTALGGAFEAGGFNASLSFAIHPPSVPEYCHRPSSPTLPAQASGLPNRGSKSPPTKFPNKPNVLPTTLLTLPSTPVIFSDSTFPSTLKVSEPNPSRNPCNPSRL